MDEVDAVPRDFFWLTSMALLAEGAAALRAPEPAQRLRSLLAPYAARNVQVGYAGSLGPVARLLDQLDLARASIAGRG